MCMENAFLISEQDARGHLNSLTPSSQTLPSEFEITFHSHNQFCGSTSIKLCEISRGICYIVTLYEDCWNETSLGIVLNEERGAIRKSPWTLGAGVPLSLQPKDSFCREFTVLLLKPLQCGITPKTAACTNQCCNLGMCYKIPLTNMNAVIPNQLTFHCLLLLTSSVSVCNYLLKYIRT